MNAAAFAASLVILSIASGCKAAPPPEAAYCAGVPQMALQGQVTDAADILNDEEEERLTDRLAQYETRTKHQMVVATVANLNGVNIEDFSTCLGNRWGIGDADRNDGVLILVAPNERRMRIATGFGMERLLPDEKAKTVISGIRPYFETSDYAGGLSFGVEAIAAQTGESR